MKTDEELKILATKSCIDDWNTMYSGNQEAEIQSFISGYKACIEERSKDPYFTIQSDGFGDGWIAGETIKLKDPRLEFLWDMYQQLIDTNEKVCDADEIKYFYDWVESKISSL